VLDLLRQAHAGVLPSGEYEGEVGLAPLHDLDRNVPSTVRQELEKIRLGMASGTITVDVPYKAPQ
jgi:basic membrane protein A and related proteins